MNDLPVSYGQGVIQTQRSLVAVNPICGGRGQLGIASATLYTAPSVTTPLGATQRAKLMSVLLCNTDTVDRTATIYVVESGGSVADNRAILKDYTITAKQTVLLDFGTKGLTMESGETVRGLASSASVVTYRIDIEELA